MILRKAYNIHGFVQSVGYRYFIARAAAEFSVAGFVKNMPDGSVYAEAQGAKEMLDLFENKLRQGPSRGHVEYIEIHDLTIETNWHGFKIL